MEQSFSLINQEVRGNAVKAVAMAPDGYEVIIRSKSKTPPQRRYWHNIIGFIAKFCGYHKEEAKHIIKETVLGIETFTDRKGKVRERVRSSEEIDAGEYSMLIDETLKVAGKLGCKIPDPSYYGLILPAKEDE